MTSRKKTLVKILKQLVGYWDLAEGFLALVQNMENEEFVEELYWFIKKQIMEVEDKQKKKQINEQLRKIKKYKDTVHKVENKEHKEADEILDDLLVDM